MPQSENWPFQRLLIDHLFRGVTRVWWTMESSFNDPQPWAFQLQVGQTGQTSALDWVDVGSPAVNAYFLDDDAVRDPAGKRLVTHYRVVLTTPRGRYVSNPQGLWGTLSVKDWNLAKEIVRKERVRMGEVSRSGYILRRMRSGRLNPANTDFLTNEVTDSSHMASWGTAYQVGYHPPVPVEIDFFEENIRERRGGASPEEWSTRPAVFPARLVGFPDVYKEDIWIDASNDQRYKIHDITVAAAWRGVPLVYTVELRLVPYDDIIYRIPVSSLSFDPTDTEKFQPTVGDGCVRVDHDYGEDSAYVYQTGDCCGIAGATILAFRKADWDDGLRTRDHAIATSQTTTNGTWAWAMMLDPGEYMLVFEKPGEYGPDVVSLVVASPVSGPPPIPESMSSSFSSSFGEF